MIVSVFDDGKRDTGYPNLIICILTCLYDRAVPTWLTKLKIEIPFVKKLPKNCLNSIVVSYYEGGFENNSMPTVNSCRCK